MAVCQEPIAAPGIVREVAMAARARGPWRQRRSAIVEPAHMRLTRLLVAAVAALALVAPTLAQIPLPLQPPFDYNPTLTTTPQQVLMADTARRRIIFFNPSAAATIAFCPSQVTRAGATFACAVNGAGSITLLPLASFVLDGGTPQGSPLQMGAAWFGVASAANSPSTVMEFE
jgi:hypothetical protein